MIALALKSMRTRRLRTALEALAIVLGVGMVVAALVVGATMSGAAGSLSKSAYSGTDAIVQTKTAFSFTAEDHGTRPTIDAAALERIRALPEVGIAVGDVTDLDAKVLGSDGEVIGTGPYFGAGIDPRAGALTPFEITEGALAKGAGQVVIDAGTAADQGLEIGDDLRVQGRGAARSYEVTGIARFGSLDSLGTGTFTLFDLETAQRTFAKGDAFDSILVSAAPGISRERLRSALGNAIPSSAEVTSAEAQDRFTLDGLIQFVSILKVILLAFGAIAVLVGAFTIFNTLSITVAQRSRELALLRTLGAARGQLLRSVLAEAVVLGLIAVIAGIGLGWLLASGLGSLMTAVGIDLPRSPARLTPGIAAAALSVGVGVTALAGLGPALRATRVSAVEALRGDRPPSPASRRGPLAGVLALSSAASMLAIAALADLGSAPTALLIGAGSLALFAGVALLAPRAVPVLAGILGHPARRIGGVAGFLARGNSMRDPRRTAVTASALMIGVALVVFVSVLGSGLRSSTVDAITERTAADYVVGSTDGYSQVDSGVRRALAGVPGVEAAASVRQDRAHVRGQAVGINAVDPAAIGRVLRYDLAGARDARQALAGDGAIVTKAFAAEHDVRVGERLKVTAPDATEVALSVRAIDSPPRFDTLDLGAITVSGATFDTAWKSSGDRIALVATDGTSAATERALSRAAAPFAGVEVHDRDTFAESQLAWISQVLGLLYVLLGLSVIVSLFGIVNTLALSVFERTRELGMLRAVGMTRRQVRRMVRHESIITALIGASLGVAIGLVIAAPVTRALSEYGFAYVIPAGSLIAIAVVAIGAGIAASVLPARRAARMDPLAALAES